MFHSAGRFVLSLALCYFVLVLFCFFGPLSIALTWLAEERANLSAFRTFVRFALVWFCLFPLPLGACEGLRLVAIPGLFSYLFTSHHSNSQFITVNTRYRNNFLCITVNFQVCLNQISCTTKHLE